jgi:SOS response regulatory protein OraA/RecX
MDLSILQKVNEMSSEGRSAVEIKQELQAGGIAPEAADQALKEAGVQMPPSQVQAPTGSSAPLTALKEHHEKIIQPSPGFDPTAK